VIPPRRTASTFQEFVAVLRNILVALEAEGAPYELLKKKSNRHDLLPIGEGTDFHFDDHPPSPT
jgi:hypothetical protein